MALHLLMAPFGAAELRIFVCVCDQQLLSILELFKVLFKSLILNNFYSSRASALK